MRRRDSCYKSHLSAGRGTHQGNLRLVRWLGLAPPCGERSSTMIFVNFKSRATEETSPPVPCSPVSPKTSQSTWDGGGKLLSRSCAWASCICKQWARRTPPSLPSSLFHSCNGENGQSPEPEGQHSTTTRSTCLSLSPGCLPSREGLTAQPNLLLPGARGA